jgi:hypothetical protein
VQIKTRAAGVLAVTAAAVAMMSGPAFASNSPVVGNIIGDGNTSTTSGNNVQMPVSMPLNFCGNVIGFLGFAEAGCRGGAAVLFDSGNTTTNNVAFDFAAPPAP